MWFFRISVRRLLLFDVLLDDSQRRAAARSGKVGRRPQHAFPVSADQGWIPLAHDAAGYTLEAVHKGRDGDLWRIVHQQVDMIVPAVHFHQLGLEVGTDRRKNLPHVVEHGGGEDVAAVFGHKD